MIRRLLLAASMACSALLLHAQQAPPSPLANLKRFYATPLNVKAVCAELTPPPGLAADSLFGTVILKVTVSADGMTAGEQVLAISDQQLAQMFAGAAQKLRFLVPKEAIVEPEFKSGGSITPGAPKPPPPSLRTAGLVESTVALYYPMPDPNEAAPPEGEFVANQIEGQPVNLGEVQELIGYPALARQQGVKGRVTVRVLSDGYGFYRRHSVLSSPSDILTAAVENHIHLLRFQPAFRNNRPAKAWIPVTFDFK